MIRNCFLALFAAAVLFGTPAILPQNSPTAEAAYKLWYCDVSYTMRGRTYRGYLGGYASYNDASRYYQMWARGIGAQYRPRLNRIFSA